jgi:hypothetical protein
MNHHHTITDMGLHSLSTKLQFLSLPMLTQHNVTAETIALRFRRTKAIVITTSLVIHVKWINYGFAVNITFRH